MEIEKIIIRLYNGLDRLEYWATREIIEGPTKISQEYIGLYIEYAIIWWGELEVWE